MPARRFSRQELAEMAGCTRETVTLALSALKRKKCVTWDPRVMRLDVTSMQRYLSTEFRVPSDSRLNVRG